MEGNEIEKAAEALCAVIRKQSMATWTTPEFVKLNKLLTGGLRENAELTRANAKVEELSQWKEDQIKLWLPVIEFMQEQSNMKWGGSISEEVLKRLKETNDLYRKANGQ